MSIYAVDVYEILDTNVGGMFLNQVVLVGGIPFSVTVPKPPIDIDASQMTDAQLHTKLQRGYEDYKAGRTQNTADAFARFTESHS